MNFIDGISNQQATNCKHPQQELKPHRSSKCLMTLCVFPCLCFTGDPAAAGDDAFAKRAGAGPKPPLRWVSAKLKFNFKKIEMKQWCREDGSHDPRVCVT